jgi:ankyrin repeat protein
MLCLLLTMGHVKNNIGRTPLHFTCYNGHTEVVKALLEKGVVE